MLVEHDLHVVRDTCDRVIVLDGGRTMADVGVHEVRDTFANNDAAAPSATPTPGPPMFHTRGHGTRVDVALIEARGVSSGYAGTAAISDVDLHVRAGEVVALLGANGAGKTTTMRTLAGQLAATRGDVLWRGRPGFEPLHRRARNGLAYVTEERPVFATLSVRSNLRLGRGSVDEALDRFPDLRPLLGKRAGSLSGGEQRMLALARALAAHPQILLIDELSLGLARPVVTRLVATMREAADRGIGVLFVEQHIPVALTIADRCYVLHQGRVVLHSEQPDAEEVEHAVLRGDQRGA
jgi:branched-chain amino acid transport system ATP-binding protein